MSGMPRQINVPSLPNRPFMKKQEDILEKIGRRDGMTVPPGYFDDFAVRMTDALPPRPEVEEPARVMPPRTLWARIRPYAYMAAMFAGIWCMLKMFSLMAPGNVDLSVENNLVLTEALSDDNFVYDYIEADINDGELIDEMWDDSVSIDDIVSDEVSPDSFGHIDSEPVGESAI